MPARNRHGTATLARESEPGKDEMTKVDLTKFDLRTDRPEGYQHARSEPHDDGRNYSVPIRILWHFVSLLVFESGLFPVYGLKVRILRMFGARLGEGVQIKPHVKIKYPWKLTTGDHVWIGEDVWLDTSKPIIMGSHVVISQGAFLCPGTHDKNDPGMGTYGYPIVIEDGVWICAKASVGMNLTLGEDSVILLGAVVLKSTEPNGLYAGNPAEKIGERRIRDYVGPKRQPTDEATPVTVAAS
jgi:putative colanic acid biosynthesis acetyltransferase WcaF